MSGLRHHDEASGNTPQIIGDQGAKSHTGPAGQTSGRSTQPLDKKVRGQRPRPWRAAPSPRPRHRLHRNEQHFAGHVLAPNPGEGQDVGALLPRFLYDVVDQAQLIGGVHSLRMATHPGQPPHDQGADLLDVIRDVVLACPSDEPAPYGGDGLTP